MDILKNYVPNRLVFIRILLFIISISVSILLGYLLIETGNKFTFTVIIVTIILFMSMYLFFNPIFAISGFFLLANNPMTVLAIIAMIMVVYYAIYFYYYYYSKSEDVFLTTNYFLDVFLLGLIIVLGLTLLYVKYKDSINLKTGHHGIILQILFFIPCLITDFIEWLRGEAKITPSSVYIILIVEILLIIMFFNISTITKWLSNNDPINHIMPEPVFLIEETKVMMAEKFNAVIQDGSGNKIAKSTFHLGFWVYLNDNMNSYKLQLPVLRYGGGTLLDSKQINKENPYGKYNSHPAIVFLPKKQENNVFGGDLDNVNIGHLGIYFSNVEKPVVIDFPLQRWNYVALNSTFNMVDVFLNGEIVYTKNMDGINDPYPIYNGSDYITIGGDNLQGSIKDIMYCDYTLSSTAIVSIYNMNMFSSKLIPAYILQ